MKGLEWKKQIKKIDTRTLEEYDKAFSTLNLWDLFKKEYEGLGLQVIHSFILNELRERNKAYIKGLDIVEKEHREKYNL